MVHLSAGINVPASEHLLSEPMIVARLAAATLPQSRVPWLWLVEDYDRIRDHIAQVFDEFKDFNQKVHRPGGFRLRNTAGERVWATPSGKAQFFAHALPVDADLQRAQALHAGRHEVFTLTTIRSHDQYNTTVYGLDDRYRGVFGQRRVLFIARADRERLGLAEAAWVDIVGGDEAGEGASTAERVAPGFLLVDHDIPSGNVAAYYPETNVLVPLSRHADGARTPASKSIPVWLRPQAAAVRPAASAGKASNRSASKPTSAI
jgi:anaerobic selenocysteine-containing dehydrogenase